MGQANSRDVVDDETFHQLVQRGWAVQGREVCQEGSECVRGDLKVGVVWVGAIRVSHELLHLTLRAG